MFPDKVGNSPEIPLKRVVFPDPFGPIIPTKTPFLISNERDCNTNLPGYPHEKSSISKKWFNIFRLLYF